MKMFLIPFGTVRKERNRIQDDKLVLQILEGQDSLKEYSITQATTDSRGILNFKVENTPKYKVILTKKIQMEVF